MFVFEDVSPGTYIHTFPNSSSNGTNLVYTLDAESFNFYIDGFRLGVLRSLDAETVSYYQLSLSDNFGEFLAVNINVTDVNDNSPIFNKTSYEFYITTPIGSTFTEQTVGSVHATDKDGPPYNIIQYTLIPETANENHFRLSSNTIILQTPWPSNKEQMNFRIMAFDGQNNNTVNVLVQRTKGELCQ